LHRLDPQVPQETRLAGKLWVRDLLLREDACQVRGVEARVLVALRALVVSLLHREGIRQKKVALEAFSFHPLSALRFLGLYAV
jgi:hypothetical protein